MLCTIAVAKLVHFVCKTREGLVAFVAKIGRCSPVAKELLSGTRRLPPCGYLSPLPPASLIWSFLALLPRNCRNALELCEFAAG